MRVLNGVFLLAAITGAVSAYAIDNENRMLNEIGQIEVAMTPNSGSAINTDGTTNNSEFEIEPQPSRVPEDTLDSTSGSDSSSGSGSVEAISYLPYKTSPTITSSASTLTSMTFAFMSAVVVYAML
ncbi:unnamed protein product [Peronospora belbahrii]|uniref:Uncharacterized protein n=1 Tax=Peronospora belbahrii TaxID=622444 RepID=A0AAU9L262_9STRA|nr:unnamed protein product [Peronospora belbahrii]CAH0522026.1 unnamed protein product [Peronospora belbahrii]